VPRVHPVKQQRVRPASQTKQCYNVGLCGIR
jgi:hypothetical protein